ncbi:amidohydrolase [Anoxybacter fermentans]|uniref:amidohydrolase n=1 Tax=Anoxybacter fermentans TaxID=1323375 RepID=UPI000F8F372B|nr:amidohydrolase [Anoxybacter fermentans]
MRLDKILINGIIITLEESQPKAEALAIKDGKIVALGTNEKILNMNHGGEVIDLKGKTVVPGFSDAHVHLIGTGLNMLGIRLNDADSLEEVLARIRNKAKAQKPGELILASGLDTNRFKEERLPTREELDDVAPHNPVFINRVDSHSCVINTKMMELIKVPLDLEGVEKDTYGLPSGFMRKAANSYVRNRVLNIIPEEMRIRAAHMAAEAAVKVGITTIHALEGGQLFNDKDVEVLLKVKNELPVHVVIWHQTMEIEKVKKTGLPRIGGCIILDGSFTSRTAALFEDYSDDPGNNGVLYYDQETVNQFVEEAYRAELQVSVHVLGERAIEQILTAHELAQKKYPRSDARHRLEHFELPTKEQIKRAVNLGIILSMQPAFEYYWGGSGMYGHRLGQARALRSNPFCSIVRAGGIIAGGSDSDVTPMNPLVGIQGAMTHSNPEERLDALEALKLFTINPAYSVFEEKERGTIKVGKYADLTILDQNPLTTKPEEIDQIQVEMTIVEGKIVFEKE